jgi:RNA polymerase sigma-70 factor, ECF subfamily
MALEGDTQAFKHLYHSHYPRVFAICLRLSGQTQMAEEISQDCFVRVWKKLHLFRGDSLFSTWLTRLCINQALTSLKAQQTLWQRYISLDALYDLPNKAQDQSAEQRQLLNAITIKETDNYHKLDECILRLPKATRIVFVLCAVEGFQHKEVAQKLNIAEGTSKAQYHRAKQLLKEMLA